MSLVIIIVIIITGRIEPNLDNLDINPGYIFLAHLRYSRSRVAIIFIIFIIIIIILSVVIIIVIIITLRDLDDVAAEDCREQRCRGGRAVGGGPVATSSYLP